MAFVLSFKSHLMGQNTEGRNEPNGVVMPFVKIKTLSPS